MTWFRTHIQANAGVALFALALQFVLSFGHHHGAIPLAPRASGLQGLEVLASLPVDPEASHDADAVCAICASVALAGNLLLPTPPLAEQPNTAGGTVLPSRQMDAVPGERQRPFQARAPPA